MLGRYWKDMWAMIKHYRNVWDPTGWTAMFLEWGALWLIAADKEVRPWHPGRLDKIINVEPRAHNGAGAYCAHFCS